MELPRLLSIWLTWTALAGPVSIVAVGDGLVAGVPLDAASPPASSTVAVPGGWVAVLADCLDERAPARFSVIDRSVPGETAATALQRVPDVLEAQPALVVLGIGAFEYSAPEADPVAFRADVDALLAALRSGPLPEVLLVGMVPPTTAQLADKPDQAAADARTGEWNGVLSAAAAAVAGVHRVDLAADWPLDERARGALTVGGWRLSDQGHARIAAVVCDAIVGWKPPVSGAPTPAPTP